MNYLFQNTKRWAGGGGGDFFDLAVFQDHGFRTSTTFSLLS